MTYIAIRNTHLPKLAAMAHLASSLFQFFGEYGGGSFLRNRFLLLNGLVFRKLSLVARDMFLVVSSG